MSYNNYWFKKPKKAFQSTLSTMLGAPKAQRKNGGAHLKMSVATRERSSVQNTRLPIFAWTSVITVRLW